MKNIIIIVGGDHHNGLGLARIFGKHDFDVHSYVITDSNVSWISKSRYISVSKTFQTEKETFDYIRDNYKDGEFLPFLIPYSDGAACELDMRLNEFKDRFYVPSINGEQGKLAGLMDKDKQCKFAQKNGIRMAKTFLVDLSNVNYDEISTIPSPYILKPYISAHGDKKDICICNDNNELTKALERFKQKKYDKVLLQEYLKIDYEIDVFGCVCKNYPYISLVPTRTIRSYPWRGGTNSFSQIIIDEKIISQCKYIINILRDVGFCGLYDIELFVVDNEIILNEINFRNSGDVYMALKQKYYYPIIWANDVLSISNDTALERPLQPSYAMTECADLRNVLQKNCSFFTWFKDYMKADDYALRYKKDMKPAYARYKYYLKKFIKNKV